MSGACAALLFGVATSDARTAKTQEARTALRPPQGAALRRAAGAVTARVGGRDAGREVLVIGLRGLRPRAEYGVYCDDPATPDPTPQKFATVRAGRDRRATLRFDTARGDGLPFGATVDQLGAAALQVRDASGFVVLSGGMPDPRGVKSSQTPTCRFLESVVFSDDFDADTAGAAPAGWDVADATVAVDAAVHDGTSGSSVAIGDADAVTAAPQVSHGFTAQSGFFAVEFTLISSPTAGRVVFRLGQDTPTGPAFATGFGDGLGFYETGSIGFGAADAVRTYAPDTAYRFRIDVDVAAKTFDVAIDGTTVVTARSLGAAGSSLDRIAFGGAAATTGDAHVDSVVVIHKTQDCPPVANAGPDRTIEVAGSTTAVTLDGSASADPEGAALTYAWSGDFTEATATGATPTVHFAGLGSHTVTLVVNDGFFDSAPDQAVIDVVDTTPPVLTVTGLPTSFWPPNHALVRVQPTVVATDNSGVAPTVTLDVTSSEPDDGTGDGSTTGDIVIRSPSDFDLRAERSGPGSGRTYRMVWTATDGSGNSSRFSADVVVPHDRGHGHGK